MSVLKVAIENLISRDAYFIVRLRLVVTLIFLRSDYGWIICDVRKEQRVSAYVRALTRAIEMETIL